MVHMWELDTVKNWTTEERVSKPDGMTPHRSCMGKCFVYFEHCIAIEGSTYLLMFGHHINGGWICVPDHSWGCEASDKPNEVIYNEERMIEAGVPENVALEMAKHIDAWLLEHHYLAVAKSPLRQQE